MKGYTGTANIRGDVPPMTGEEKNLELVRGAMHNIKEGLAGIALWLMIIAICQVVTCGIAVLK